MKSWEKFYVSLLVFLGAHVIISPIVIAVIVLLICTINKTLSAIAAILLIGYLCTYMTSATVNGNRHWKSYVRFWKRCHKYFPVNTFVWNGENYDDKPSKKHENIFNPTKTYIFGVHPHGPLPVAGSTIMPQLSTWGKPFTNMRFLTATSALAVPFLRDFYLWLGCVDAGRKAAQYVLDQGINIGLCPGGIEESMLVNEEDSEVLILRKRRGFIRLAIKNGADLVPVYGFGQREVYSASNFLISIREWLSVKYRIGIPVCWGLSKWLPLMPNPTPILLVVGKPIRVKQNLTPSDNEIDQYLDQYEKSLHHIFEMHKEYNGKVQKLIIK